MADPRLLKDNSNSFKAKLKYYLKDTNMSEVRNQPLVSVIVTH